METQDTVTISAMEANRMREACKKQIDLAEAMTRLEQNQDFKKVFIDNYEKDEAVRLVGLLAEQTITMSDKKDMFMKDINERMIGIARFGEYVRGIYAIADRAAKTLEDLNSAETVDF